MSRRHRPSWSAVFASWREGLLEPSDVRAFVELEGDQAHEAPTAQDVQLWARRRAERTGVDVDVVQLSRMSWVAVPAGDPPLLLELPGVVSTYPLERRG